MTSRDHENHGMLIMAIAIAGLSLIWGEYTAAALSAFMAAGTVADMQWRRWRRWRNRPAKGGE